MLFQMLKNCAHGTSVSSAQEDTKYVYLINGVYRLVQLCIWN